MKLSGITILHDGADREEWLDARAPFLTATQVAAIAGSHPYSKMIDVWNEKTDPDYQREERTNRWLEERAAFGTASEPEIIAWASEQAITGGPGNPFIPNTALMTRTELLEEFSILPPASTPDAYKYARPGVLVLLECKATESDWREGGLPQHIYDQVLWQLYTTGAVTVWLAVRQVRWVGRGKNKTPEVIDHYALPIQQDPKRLAFLLARAEEFRENVRQGIAPESDVYVTGLAAPEFDATEQELAEWAEAQEVDMLLTEADELEERLEADAKRLAEIKAELGRRVREYDGRRVWLVGTRRIAKLVRFWKADVDTSQLPADTLRQITDWKESSRVVIERNPDWTAAAVQD